MRERREEFAGFGGAEGVYIGEREEGGSQQFLLPSTQQDLQSFQINTNSCSNLQALGRVATLKVAKSYSYYVKVAKS